MSRSSRPLLLRQRAQQIETALGRGVGRQPLGLAQAGDQLARIDVAGRSNRRSPGRARGGVRAAEPSGQTPSTSVPASGSSVRGRRAVAALAAEDAGEAAQPRVDRS